MLTEHIERYIALRQSLGFKFSAPARHLRAFARFASAAGQSHVQTQTAIDWASKATSPHTQHVLMRDVIVFARFAHAEDPRHTVPPSNPFRANKSRTLPYIYTPEELARIVETAGRLSLKRSTPLRRRTYPMLFGLLAATGLRLSEALDLHLDDVLPDGILRIRQTKFNKSRLIPLDTTVVQALDRYLDLRRRHAVVDDHLFLSMGDRRLSSPVAEYTFGRVRRIAEIAPGRSRRPRIHDLRHTFATRSLERCATRREDVGRHFVALATYLGHADISHTYWYLEATPELMLDIAAAGEIYTTGQKEQTA